ncbi:MAG: hypothetical protein AB7D07_09215 [Desulfovibrionaceae bacterium]|jgi:hypothetical protein
MGKTLTIRVSASTYDVREVARRWPALCRLAWPSRHRDEDPDGVLQLVSALHDRARFSDDMSREAKEMLADGAAQAARLARDLEDALGERNPQAADKISYEIEDCLDGLEKNAAKL